MKLSLATLKGGRRFGRRMPHEAYVESLLACRHCTSQSAEFARLVGPALPMLPNGPDRCDVLIVSINPMVRDADPAPTTPQGALERSRRIVSDNPFDKAVAACLPGDLAIGVGATNTRIYRCPTRGEPKTRYPEVDMAAECSKRFLRAELDQYRPKVLLVLGKTAVRGMARFAGVAEPQDLGAGAQTLPITVDGVEYPAVWAHHPTRKSHEYRAGIAEAVAMLLG